MEILSFTYLFVFDTSSHDRSPSRSTHKRISTNTRDTRVFKNHREIPEDTYHRRLCTTAHGMSFIADLLANHELHITQARHDWSRSNSQQKPTYDRSPADRRYCEKFPARRRARLPFRGARVLVHCNASQEYRRTLWSTAEIDGTHAEEDAVATW